MSLSTHCQLRQQVPRNEAPPDNCALQSAMQLLQVQQENRNAAQWSLTDAHAAFDMAEYAVRHAGRKGSSADKAGRDFFAGMSLVLLDRIPTVYLQ